MALLDQLTEDMKQAMKARETDRLATIRLLLSDLKTERINKMADLSPEDEIAFLTRQAKRRREAIEAFDGGGRAEMAAQERTELAIIQTYLPQQLTEAEALEIVKATIAELGATSPKDLGKVMGALKPRLQGRYPGAEIKALVSSLL